MTNINKKYLHSLKLSSTIEITDEADKKAIKKKHLPLYISIPEKNLIAKIEQKNGKIFILPFSTFVTIKNVIINENGETFFRLQYKNKKGMEERDFSAIILSPEVVKTLLRYGITFNEKGGACLIDYLIEQQETAPVINIYSHLGWNQYNDELAFNYDYLCTKDGYYENVQYSGDFDIEHAGDYDIWERMVIKEVCGKDNAPMEFVLALGFASPVLALLDQSFDLGAMLVNLSNSTSKGKTTAAMLAASVFGKPKTGNSTMLSYNITKNALPETISKFNGITVAIDEAAILKSKDFSKLLYTICSGTSKGRIKSTGNGGTQLDKVTHFSSIVVSTAEFDLLTDDSEGGLRVRVFELNDTFTTSAENSNIIKKTVLKNYGEAGIGFVMHFMKHHAMDLEEDYEEIIHLLKLRFVKKTDITDRLIERFAVILLTAIYCNDCEYFRFEFNINALLEYVVEQIKNIAKKLNYEERIREIILEDYSINMNSYPSVKEDLKERLCNSKIRGLIEKRDGYKLYYIMPSVFEQLMNEKRIPNITTKLKQLKKLGVLCPEDEKRLVKRVKIRVGERISMYCFKFTD